MGFLGKVESLGDHLGFLAVVRGEVGVEQMAEGFVYHLLVPCGVGDCWHNTHGAVISL